MYFGRRIRRILCAAVAVSLLAGVAASADGSVVQVIEENKLEEPTEFPAKGFILTETLTNTEIEEDGKALYTYEEGSIPVLVTEDRNVYARVDYTASLLGLECSINGNCADVIVNESIILIEVGDSHLGYTNHLFSCEVDIGQPPLMYDGNIYVLLDPFLYLTGTVAIYGKENWMGQKELYLLPPERTLVDDMIKFICGSSYYMFHYQNLGYTEEITEEMAKQAEIAQIVQKMGELDPRSWIDAITAQAVFPDSTLMEKYYIEDFVEYLVTQNEEIDAFGVQSAVKETKGRVGALLEQLKTVSVGSVEEAQEQLEREGIVYKKRFFEEFREIEEDLPEVPYAIDAMTIILHYSLNQNEDEVQAIRTFLDYRNILQKSEEDKDENAIYDNPYLAGGNHPWMAKVAGGRRLTEKEYKKIEKFTDDYGWSQDAKNSNSTMEQVKSLSNSIRNMAETTIGKFLERNGAGMLLTAMEKLGILATGELGVAAMVWSMGTKLFLGEELETTENFLTGIFGIAYQEDAVRVAQLTLEDMIAERMSVHDGLPDQQKEIFFLVQEGLPSKDVAAKQCAETFSSLFYNAAKSCYTARYMGCKGAQYLVNSHPELQKKQNAINEELAELCARFKSLDVPLGLLPDMLNDFVLQDHYPNVIFNIVEVHGQILRWEDEEPAKNVRVDFISDTGTLLNSFKTDRNGMFDERIMFDDFDPKQANLVQRDPTLHLYYKDNPVTIESLQLNIFRRSEITGLHVGIKQERMMAYLMGAVEEDGKTSLDLLPVTVADDTYTMEMEYPGGDFTIYMPMPSQKEEASDLVRMQMDDAATLDTLSGMAADNPFTQGLLQFASILDDSEFSSMFKSDLHEAGEIQETIDSYHEVNGEYPAYELVIENSLIREIRPAMILEAPEGITQEELERLMEGVELLGGLGLG